MLEYRNTPITGLKRSPAQLIFNRQVKTKLSSVEKIRKYYRDHFDRLEEKRNNFKQYYRSGEEKSELISGEKVVVRGGNEWQPARVISNKENKYIL